MGRPGAPSWSRTSTPAREHVLASATWTDVGGTLFFKSLQLGTTGTGAVEERWDRSGHRPRQGHPPRHVGALLPPVKLTEVGGTLYFSSSNGHHWLQELWRSGRDLRGAPSSLRTSTQAGGAPRRPRTSRTWPWYPVLQAPINGDERGRSCGRATGRRRGRCWSRTSTPVRITSKPHRISPMPTGTLIFSAATDGTHGQRAVAE